MAIQRVEFANCGQDFLWWEIDDQTGRVVGCGPFQAGTWAAGRHSVDLSTLAVGAHPRVFGPSLGPQGSELRYAIEAIAPAPGGSLECLTQETRQ